MIVQEKIKQIVDVPRLRQGETTTLLNSLLADEFHLYVTTRRAQRDINETNFNVLNKFFEVQFQILENIIQRTDERVYKVGRFSPNSLNDFLKLGRLNGTYEENNDKGNIVNKLLEYHKLIINLLHNDIMLIIEANNDSDTSSFLSELLEQHEKIVWMLESHLP